MTSFLHKTALTNMVRKEMRAQRQSEPSSKSGSSGYASISFLIIGVLIGFSIKKDTIEGELTARNCFNRAENSHITRTLMGLEEVLSIQSLSETQYSCNAQKAFEELTSLHKRARDLESRRNRGEANRSRQGTISRKAAAAEAAENAFRKCTAAMMPELLKLWDDKFRNGELHSQSWNEASEAKIDGITFALLEETADALD